LWDQLSRRMSTGSRSAVPDSPFRTDDRVFTQTTRLTGFEIKLKACAKARYNDMFTTHSKNLTFTPQRPAFDGTVVSIQKRSSNQEKSSTTGSFLTSPHMLAEIRREWRVTTLSHTQNCTEKAPSNTHAPQASDRACWLEEL